MRVFFDSNILVYAFSRDPRAERAQELLQAGGVVGIQCLNEFVNVGLNKLKLSWREVHAALETIRGLCEIEAPIDMILHEGGLAIAQRYRLRIYDALIVAAALATGCPILWSEDMQDGLVVEGRLRISNPFLR